MKSVTSSRDEYIMECLQAVRAMLYNLARKFDVEFEDLCQQATLIALLCYERGLLARNPEAYMRSCIRYEIIAYIVQQPGCYSLDEPIAEDTKKTYKDLLVAPSGTPEDTRTDQRIGTLHTALKRLPLEEQQYLREVYQLNAFQPVPTKRKPNYNRTRSALSMASFRRLRSDATLMQAIAL